MDDMKDKFKGFVKKVNNSLSSSSSVKFKGQGRVLGGSSSSSGLANPVANRTSQTLNSNASQTLATQANSRSSPQRTSNSQQKVQNNSEISNNSEQSRKQADGFDPFDSLITSGKRNPNGYSLNVFECPVCGRAFGSEEEVSNHVESCLSSSEANNKIGNEKREHVEISGELRGEFDSCVSAYFSGKPSAESSEIVLKLLKNIVREPENAKFRKIRMGNPKIREAVVEVVGGVELLECVGFQLKEEGGEMWAVMEVPSNEQIASIKNAILMFGPQKIENFPSTAPVKVEESSTAPVKVEELVEKKKVDREIRVFFAVPESVAAKIELPDSFYNLSLEELKREADMRKKKIAESQLLIPKSYKEKQAKAARKRYTKTIIRVQFPDGVVLQGMFSCWEPTSALYEFVSSALKEPCLDFELCHPIVIKRGVIPSFPAAGERATTLEDEDLVPSALIKCRPIETDSVVFTGLRNDLLEISEPLGTDSAVPTVWNTPR